MMIREAGIPCLLALLLTMFPNTGLLFGDDRGENWGSNGDFEKGADLVDVLLEPLIDVGVLNRQIGRRQSYGYRTKEDESETE